MPRFTHPSERRDGSRNLQKGLPSTSITAYIGLRKFLLLFYTNFVPLSLSMMRGLITYVKFRVSPDCRDGRLVKLVGIVRT